MVANTIMTARNHDNNEELINMLAISIIKRTKYACNLKSKSDYTNSPIMLAIIKILFSRDSSKNHCNVILGPFLTLQAYLVLFRIEIASIFGTCHKNYCNHMCSILILSLNLFLIIFNNLI